MAAARWLIPIDLRLGSGSRHRAARTLPEAGKPGRGLTGPETLPR